VLIAFRKPCYHAWRKYEARTVLTLWAFNARLLNGYCWQQQNAMVKVIKSGVTTASGTCTRAMLSSLRANNLHLRTRGLPLIHTHNFVSSSNGAKKRRSRSPKPSSDTLEHAAPTTPQQTPVAVEGSQFAALLSHYSRLPPLPPIGDWLSHFSFAPNAVRDRISIRDPASAIRVAQSFITSKKTSTGNPKVIIEAFPGT
jgi:hypothetical protein